MRKTLYELSLEYEASAQLLDGAIAELCRQRQKARSRKDSDEVKRISAHLLTLYEEKRDLKITAELLKNYYAPRGAKTEVAV